MPVIHRRIYRCRKAQPAQCVPESRHCSYTGVYMRSLCTHAYVSQRERMRDASKKVSPFFSDAFASLLTHFPNTSRVTRYPPPIISRFNITGLIFTSHFISASRDCHFKHVLCFKVPTVALILLTYRVITSLWVIRVDARTGAFDIYHLITRKHADATRRFHMLIPRDANCCVSADHCYGNECFCFYLPILKGTANWPALILMRVSSGNFAETLFGKSFAYKADRKF